jgi:hypothetical protein
MSCRNWRGCDKNLNRFGSTSEPGCGIDSRARCFYSARSGAPKSRLTYGELGYSRIARAPTWHRFPAFRIPHSSHGFPLIGHLCKILISQLSSRVHRILTVPPSGGAWGNSVHELMRNSGNEVASHVEFASDFTEETYGSTRLRNFNPGFLDLLISSGRINRSPARKAAV